MPQIATDTDLISGMWPRLEQRLAFGMHHHNCTTSLSRWSRGIFRILDYKEIPEDTGEDFLLKHVSTEEDEHALEILTALQQTGNDYEHEFYAHTQQGNRKRLRVETEFLKNDKNVTTAYCQIVSDITENHDYKLGFDQKVQQLNKSNRNLQEFVYVASHDLQEPLRKISTFGERLQNKFGLALGEEGNMYMGRMLKSVKNMQTLLEDLLNFSRLAPVNLVPEKVSLNDCLQEALNDLDVKIEETGANLFYPDLPVIEGYKTQLKQLLSNIIGNAIKFRKPGVPPEIRITCTRINPYLYPQFDLLKNTHYTRIDIADNGIGFDNDYAEKIFQIFQRLNSKTEYSGSGVGLSICKRIAENHQGYIFALSQPNTGSTFTILLPYTFS